MIVNNKLATNYDSKICGSGYLEKQIKKEKSKKSDYIISIIFNLILLYVFNNLLNWHVYFVTNALNSVLWIINLSIIATIIINTLLLFYDPEWFRHVMKIILNIFAFIAVYFLYNAFPFNFNNIYINWGLKILLIVGMIGIAIAFIEEFYLLITRRPEK
jgi:hypothetical protein